MYLIKNEMGRTKPQTVLFFVLFALGTFWMLHITRPEFIQPISWGLK